MLGWDGIPGHFMKNVTFYVWWLVVPQNRRNSCRLYADVGKIWQMIAVWMCVDVIDCGVDMGGCGRGGMLFFSKVIQG